MKHQNMHDAYEDYKEQDFGQNQQRNDENRGFYAGREKNLYSICCVRSSEYSEFEGTL